MSQGVVAADVGNSAIKFWADPVASGDPEGRQYRLPIDRDHRGKAGWSSDLRRWVEATIGDRRPQWRIASVHRAAADRLQQSVTVLGDAEVRRVTRQHVPMSVSVDHPDRLGIDRLLGAYAAKNRQPGPLVVVDAGSAVTVDWVDADGTFCGGAILPGVGLQFSALAAGTDALPCLETGLGNQPDESPSDRGPGPGKNTTDAIRLGVVMGIAAAIDRLATHYSRRAGLGSRSVPLLLTGGDAERLTGLLALPHELAANLVCQGLLDLPPSTWTGCDEKSRLR